MVLTRKKKETQLYEGQIKNDYSKTKSKELSRVVWIKYFFIITILSLVLTTINTFSFAQSMRGKVENKNGIAVEFATIKLEFDSTNFKSTVTDKEGNFNFNDMQKTNYKITASFINSISKDITFFFSKDTFLLIKIEENIKNLAAVKVVSKKPVIERKIDRIVFNVDNIITTGLSIPDLLSKTPLLQVKNDLPSIIGKSSVGIMINEKIIRLSGEALVEFLKSIPTETVTRIEVITNPPSQYEAEGLNGYVNIVTKSVKKLEYTSTISQSFTFINKDASGTQFNMSFNYNQKKIQYICNLGYNYGAQTSTFINKIQYPDYTWNAYSSSKELSRALRGTIGFEVPYSKDITFGATYSTTYSKPDQFITNDTKIFNNQFVLDSFITFPVNDYKLFFDQTANIHFAKNIDSTGKKLVIDLDWSKNKFDLRNELNKTTYSPDGQIKPNSEVNDIAYNTHDASVKSINVQLKFPLKKSSFDFGGKVSLFTTENDITFYNRLNNVSVLNYNKTDNFRVNENVQALFSNYSNKYKKWEFQIGVRGEFTQTNGISKSLLQNNSSNYFNIFPTLFIAYNLNEKNDFSFSYGKRLKRPSFSSLNPFKTFNSYFDYTEGNPFLKPYFSQNFEIGHTYNNFLTSTIMLSSTKNSTIFLTTPNPTTNIRITSPSNSLLSFDFLYDISAVFNKAKWFSSTNEVAVYYSEIKSKQPSTKSINKGWSSQLKTINTIYFNKSKTLMSMVDFIYQFPEISLIGTTKSQNYTNISFRYKLLKNKLQLGIGLRDIFKSKNYQYEDVVNGITSYSFVNNGTRRLTFNVQYSFGNNKLKRGSSHSAIGNDGGRIL